MSASLVCLSLSAFTLAASSVSGAVTATLPWLDRLSAALKARHQVSLWLALASLPSCMAAIAVGTSFLPAVGIGQDHCLTHGSHHPHLCPHHAGAPPGWALMLLSLLLGVRVLVVLTALVRDLRLSGTTSDTLAQVSDRYAEALVFPGADPQAFVLGVVRPRIHLSHGLVNLGNDMLAPVLAHERVHAARRDPLWRALAPVLAIGHLPSTMKALQKRLYAAQELAADAEAATTLRGGRPQLAAALVFLARFSGVTALGPSFTQGDLPGRVHALLDERGPTPAWLARSLVFFAVALLAAVGALAQPIHHLLETVLGALS
ncbi:MAG: M56 family metallopeptidase [Myxococcota bacterium]